MRAQVRLQLGTGAAVDERSDAIEPTRRPSAEALPRSGGGDSPAASIDGAATAPEPGTWRVWRSADGGHVDWTVGVTTVADTL